MGNLFWIMAMLGLARQAADATRLSDNEVKLQRAQIEISRLQDNYSLHWPFKRSPTDVVNWPPAGSSLLGAAVFDPRRLQKLRNALSDFREFRLRLSKSEEHTFAKLCTESRGRPHIVSCGETFDCFMYFFFSYHYIDHLLSGPTQKQQDAALGLYGDTGNEVKKMLDLNDWNGIMSSFAHREVVRSFSRVPVDELTATLLRDDKKADLPRMFAVYMQWDVLRHDVRLHVRTEELMKQILAWALKEEASQLDEAEFTEHQDLWALFKTPETLAHHLLPGWKHHIVAALRQLVQKPATPATVVLSGLKAPKKPLTFDLSLDQVNEICNRKWVRLGGLVSKNPPEAGMRNFSGECDLLKVGSKKVWEHETTNYQNHIFAVVKRHNNDFSIVQGYIGEQGYDLSGWAGSKNRFASPMGFDSATMRQFLRHLSTFVENGAGGTFNGDNHYATFDHFEPTFHGKSYRPLFSFSEALATNLRDNSGSLVRENLIKPLIEEMDRCNCSTVEWPLHQVHQDKDNTLSSTGFSTSMPFLDSISEEVRPLGVVLGAVLGLVLGVVLGVMRGRR